MEFFERPSLSDQLYAAAASMVVAMLVFVAGAGLIHIEEAVLRWSRFFHFIRII